MWIFFDVYTTANVCECMMKVIKKIFFLQFEMQFYSQAAFLFCCRKISKITILTKTKAET